jgi:NO-binding membrane sensor protein with MHYT domain
MVRVALLAFQPAVPLAKEPFASRLVSAIAVAEVTKVAAAQTDATTSANAPRRRCPTW